MMNTDRIREAAARFMVMDNANVPPGGMGFDMAHFLHSASTTDHPCGAACCITGWCQTWYQEDGEQCTWGSKDLAKCFDISCGQADKIAVPCEKLGAYGATPQQAGALLYHLAETGEVDWPRALKAAAPRTEPPTPERPAQPSGASVGKD